MEVHAHAVAQHPQGHLLPLIDHHARRALVKALLWSDSPATVARLVMPVAVKAIQRVRERRARPHIFDESLKRSQPAVTDTNAARAVSLVSVSDARIVA